MDRKRASERDRRPTDGGPGMVGDPTLRRKAAAASSQSEQQRLVSRLKTGDESAMTELVSSHHASMIRFAMAYVRNRASAEEVVQETWLAVIDGLGGFEARSALLTWIYSILANKARTRGVRDARSTVFSDLEAAGRNDVPGELGRFDGNGRWSDPPRLLDDLNPERIVAGRQLWAHVTRILDELPAMQRAVIVLQDIEEQEPEVVCQLLQLTNANRRVLLHRARARIRQEIERILDGTDPRAKS